MFSLLQEDLTQKSLSQQQCVLHSIVTQECKKIERLNLTDRS